METSESNCIRGKIYKECKVNDFQIPRELFNASDYNSYNNNSNTGLVTRVVSGVVSRSNVTHTPTVGKWPRHTTEEASFPKIKHN